MNAELHQVITARLLSDFQFKQQEEWLRGGICPKCAKKELYTPVAHPWLLRCGRLNKCGTELHIKDVYPELFDSWSDRFPQTETNPCAAAKAYLSEMRGFDLSKMEGWYTQENYYDPQKDMGSATVRFTITENVYWERIIDRPHRFDRKANFIGKYAGYAWYPPQIDLNNVKTLWIVEGIFDAIALYHHGISAISIMSCSNYPTHFLHHLRMQSSSQPVLVWALDNDKAGHRFIRKWLRRAQEEGWQCKAALTHDAQMDWNDCHQKERLTPKALQEYFYHGSLFIAKSANEKALLTYEKTQQKEFPFEFEHRLFWFKMDVDKFSKSFDSAHASQLSDDEIKENAIRDAGIVTEIANCYPIALYYQANAITDESWYYFRVDFPDDRPAVKNTFTGSQLSSASEFKKRLLHIAQGAIFTGQSAQLDRFLLKKLPHIKTVQTIDFTGYSKEYQAYIYNDVAILNGKIYQLNDEDFFDMPHLSIKTLNKSVSLTLNANLKEYNCNWIHDLWRAFGEKGIVVLAFWLGSFFAEQIRQKYKSYPFLEVVGEPGTGKTTLIEFMWKLCGRNDYEGFDPSKSSLAARARNFAQVANMPIVLIEGDRNQDSAKQKGFDWDELKTAYNGRSVRARGMKNSGNETYEPPFRGAIVIAQNAEVNASEAILQRIIHIFTDRANQTANTKIAAENLERLPVEQLSGFLIKSAQVEKEILHLFDKQVVHYETELTQHSAIKNIRIIKNHAQIMALLDALMLVVEIDEQKLAASKACLTRLAVERQQAINADHPLVQEFWDVYDYLENSAESEVNHSRDPQLIAINLNHFLELSSNCKQNTPSATELKRLLKTSRKYPFIDIRTVNSLLHDQHNKKNPLYKKPTTIKCWLFKKN